MPPQYRLATCSEFFGEQPFARVCRTVRELGYDGLEIAPFTLAGDPASLPAHSRAEVRAAMESEGLRFVGLHWLLMAPPGLHITTADKALRRHSWEYVRRLVDLCADLATTASEWQPVVVFGSPKQRSSRDGMTAQEATALFVEELANAAPHAAAHGVKLLVEALSPSQTDVVTSLAEAVAIVEQIGSPAVETMFDVHNAIDETEAHNELIRRFARHIRHVHVNEMDGREPGMGNYDFSALLETLDEVKYSGWVSLEAFDFSRDPREIAARAITHLKASQPAPTL